MLPLFPDFAFAVTQTFRIGKQTDLYELASHLLFIKANIVRSRIKLQLFCNRVDPLLTEQGFPGCDKKIKGRPPASTDDSHASALLEWQRVCVKIVRCF